MYASTTILNTFITMQPGRRIMGYLKLVYLAQGWSFAFDRPIVADLPSLLPFGPGHLIAYDAMRMHGREEIHAPVCAPGFVKPICVPATDVATIDLLKQVIDTYGHFTDVQLANHCHREGTPWRTIKDSRSWKTRAGGIMTQTEIRDHFLALIEEHGAKNAAEATSVGSLDTRIGSQEATATAPTDAD
jgi:uncharacterized phage-associated protein